jgi:hypothetical protein
MADEINALRPFVEQLAVEVFLPVYQFLDLAELKEAIQCSSCSLAR